MKHVVMLSGGVGSYCAAKRVIAEHGHDDVVLLFTDTLIEDADLYRFLDDSERVLEHQIVRIADGRTPWQVFRDHRFMGSSRLAHCSIELKSKLAQRWVKEHTPEATIYLGIDWTEEHRLGGAAKYWQPLQVKAPMCEPPYLTKKEQFEIVVRDGIALPRLYALGFAHNNCGGFCVKAGQAHFRHLLKTFPDLYAFHEEEEQKLREYIGKPVSAMADRRGGGPRKPLTMRDFRLMVEDDEKAKCIDMFDWGGCGCFIGDTEETETETEDESV